MRRLVASALLMSCAALTTGCGVLDDVTASKPPELGSLETFRGDGFSVKLPCIPAKSSHKTPVQGRTKPLPTRLWTCEGPDTLYAVASTPLPANVQGNLEGAAQGAADAVDGKVMSNKRVTYAGLPARDVRIESTYDGKSATMFGRVLVQDRVLYQVQVVVIGKHTSKPPARYRKILTSLSFR